MTPHSEIYLRPLVQWGPGRSEDAYALAGGDGWFSDVEVLRRGQQAHVVPASDLSAAQLAPFLAPRPNIAGLKFDRPRVMGILNATPDSFSDGGDLATAQAAVAAGLDMVQAGVDIIDIGGESTRPGAAPVANAQEIERVIPVIEGLRAHGVTVPISVDTRKAEVARAALRAGADLINDVSGFTHDPALAKLAAETDTPVCVMHGPFDPATMQNAPGYDDVLLDVYDFLAERIAALIAQGIDRTRIIADPGIGFGKTLEHNLALLSRLGLFGGLGVPLLLGASRKKFIGTIGKAPAPRDRMAGSLAVALAGIAQGAQICRVHDVAETRQAIALWRASVKGSQDE